MNNQAYFKSPILSFGNALIDNGEKLVKRAIIAIEGCHTCNRGTKHDFSSERIRQIAENTNQEILNGRIISLFLNHKKSSDAAFGNLTGLVECRPVAESDLPTPEARGMLGKLAIFANTSIIKHTDKIKSGLIKALSPGIDTARNIIFEVSAVPVAAMPGVAFFSYQDIKQQRQEFAKKREAAIECLDTFVESLRQAQQPSDLGVAANNDVEQNQWFADFVSDLRSIFDLPEVQDTTGSGVSYATNPYDRDLIKGFSSEEVISEFAESPKLSEQEKESVTAVAAEVLKTSQPPSRIRRRVAAKVGGRS